MVNRTWDAWEIDFLKENHLDKKLCSKKLNRSISSIEHKASRLKLSYSFKWSDDQIKILLDNYPDYGIDKCVDLLKLPIGKIKSKISNLKLKTNRRKNYDLWTNEELNFLKENYENFGSKFCKNNINKSLVSIRSKAKELGIKASKKLRNIQQKIRSINYWSNQPLYKNPKDYSVNPLPFINVNEKEAAYLLGFIWADGYLYNGQKSHVINMQILSSDMNDILHLFQKYGKWNVYTKKAKGMRKQATVVTTTNKMLYHFLKENNYEEKSLESAHLILEKIPDDLKPYWWRGYSDGDGCFYVSDKAAQFCFAGSLNQDWKFVEDLLNQLNLKYKIARRKSKKGNSSVIRMSNRQDIIEFGKYIYNNYDGIGLKRKFDKFNLIMEKLKNDI